MARIQNIEMDSGDGRLHPTLVNARVKIFGDGGEGPVVQIDTFGSDERQEKGKLSQTIQFDRPAGLQLLAILQKAYG